MATRRAYLAAVTVVTTTAGCFGDANGSGNEVVLDETVTADTATTDTTTTFDADTGDGIHARLELQEGTVASVEVTHANSGVEVLYARTDDETEADEPAIRRSGEYVATVTTDGTVDAVLERAP